MISIVDKWLELQNDFTPNYRLIDANEHKGLIEELDRLKVESRKEFDKVEQERTRINEERNERIDEIQRALQPIIYIILNKDNRNNTQTLMARCNFKDRRGKIHKISAYIGTVANYPQGVDDPKAYKKGYNEIIKKVKLIIGK